MSSVISVYTFPTLPPEILFLISTYLTDVWDLDIYCRLCKATSRLKRCLSLRIPITTPLLNVNRYFAMLASGQVHSLRSLGLSGCSSDIFNALCNSGIALHSLVLYDCARITNIQCLKSITTLTDLQLRWSPNIRDLSSLKHLTNLTGLSVKWADDICDLSALANLTNLTSLDLSWCGSIMDARPLKTLTKLVTLNLGMCQELRFIPSMKHYRSLVTLDLTYCDGIDREALYRDVSENLPGLKITGMKWDQSK